jgi:hypothetical protein
MREIRLGNLEADYFGRTLVASGFENLVVETLVDDVSEIDGLVPVRLIRILLALLDNSRKNERMESHRSLSDSGCDSHV